MDSCSTAAADSTKSHRAIRSSAKPFLILHAAASSKPRTPSASASKSSARFHPPSSKIPAPLGRNSEKKSDAVLILQGPPSPKSGEKSVARDEVLRKEKVVVKDEGYKDEKTLVTDQALQEEKVGMEDEALKKEKEDEAVGTEKEVTKDDTLGEEMMKAGDQSDVSLLLEIKQNDIAEKVETEGEDCAEIEDTLAGKEEKKGGIPFDQKEKDAGPWVLKKEGANTEKEEKKGDCAETPVIENSEESLVAVGSQKDGVPFDQKEKDSEPLLPEKEGTNTENASTNFLKVPAQQGPSSPLAETKTIVYSEQNRTVCTGQTGPGCLKQTEGELDVKLNGRGLIFTEHLDSEQEGFLFAKGEPIFKEPIQSSESLPAAECSTLKKFKEQDVSSLTQFEAAVIAASDLKLSPSATILDVACNGISSMPSPEATGFMEAAMVALAEDVFAAKCLPLENVQRKSVVQSAFSCPWKLPRRALVLPSLVVPALICLCFASAVSQDENRYLRPT